MTTLTKELRVTVGKTRKRKQQPKGRILSLSTTQRNRTGWKALYPEKAFFWIGLRVPKKGASWRWESDELLTYTNWGTAGKPKNISTH